MSDSRASPQEERHARAAPWLIALAVALASAAPFAASARFDFLAWDDDVNFAAPALRTLDAQSLRWMWSHFHVGHYAPLTWMSCAFDFARGGDQPARALHETNLALHGASAAALFGALYTLLRQHSARARSALIASALAALAWGVHPLRVESVAWLTERRDVLSGLFYALCALTWLHSTRASARRWLWLALSLACFAAALLSKVSGVGLPLVFLALDAWPSRRLSTAPRAALLEKLPFFALALGGALLGVLGQRTSTQVLASADELGLAQRLAIAAHASVFYVVKTLAPTGLSPLYELPQSIELSSAPFALPLGACALVTGLLAAFRRRGASRALAVAAFSYLVLLAPVSGLAHAGRQLAADRYSYLPSFALAGLVAAALARWSTRTTFALAATAAAALAWGAWNHTRVWSATQTLFERAVAIEPQGYWANHKLGILHHQAGRHELALEHYARALSTRPERGNADAYFDRALTWLRVEQLAAGRRDLDAALRDAPEHAGAHAVLTDLDRVERRLDAARARLERAFEHSLAPALGGQLASLWLELEQPTKALEVAERVQRRWPGDARGHKLAGMACLHLGRVREAEQALRAALALERTPATLYNLAVALERQGRNGEARDALDQVLALEPGNERARAKLGQLRAGR